MIIYSEINFVLRDSLIDVSFYLKASFILLIFPPKRFPVDLEWTNFGVFPRLEAKLASKEIPFSAGLISSITLFSEPAWEISVFFGVLFVDAPGVIRMWLKGWKEKRPPADFVAVE